MVMSILGMLDIHATARYARANDLDRLTMWTVFLDPSNREFQGVELFSVPPSELTLYNSLGRVSWDR